MTTSTRQLRMRTKASVLLLGATLALSACGDDDDEATGTPTTPTDTTSASTAPTADAGTANAQALLDRYKANPTKIGITTPVGKPIPTGKTIVYVSCGATPCDNTGDSIEAAAKELGWTIKRLTVGGAGGAADIQKTFDEAVRLKPDGVAYLGLPAAAIQNQLDALEAAKIPVAAMFVEDPIKGAIKFTFANAETVGRGTEILAAKTIVDNNKAKIGTVNITNYPVVPIYRKAYEDFVTANCPACTLKNLDLPQEAIVKGTSAGDIVSFIRANAGMDTLFLTLDDFAIGLPAALKQAGLADTVKIYSWAPTEDGVLGLQTGTRRASSPTQQAEGGWYLADAFARLFTEQPVAAVGVEETPWVIWAKDTPAGVPTETKNPSFITDYQAQFKALWGK